MENNEIPTQKEITAIPKDEIVEAIIVDLKMSTWNEITKDDIKRKNLTEPTGKVLLIRYDSKGIIRQDTFPINKIINDNQKYGRLCLKYNTDKDPDFRPTIGMKLKVYFDGEGKSNIVLK